MRWVCFGGWGRGVDEVVGFGCVGLLVGGMFSYLWSPAGDARWLFYPYIKYYNVPIITIFH